VSGSIGVTGAQQGVVGVTDLVDGLAGVELGVAAVARQMTLLIKPDPCILHPFDEWSEIAITLPGVPVEVELLGSVVTRSRSELVVNPIQSPFVETFDFVPLNVEKTELFDAFKVEIQVGQLIVSKVQVLKVGQSAKRVVSY